MPKGNVLKCPDCGWTYEQLNDEDVWCTGRREGSTVGHKKAKRMK